jgi:hypothetical protein
MCELLTGLITEMWMHVYYSFVIVMCLGKNKQRTLYINTNHMQFYSKRKNSLYNFQ